MTPEIVEREEVIVVGIRTILQLGEGAPTDLWTRDFMPRLGELRPLDSNFYAVFGPLPGDKTGRLEYVAGVMTNSLENIPIGMVGWIIPAGMYAVIEAKGVGDIGGTCRSLLTDWLPDSGYKRLAGPMFACTEQACADIASTPWRVNVPIETSEMAAQLETWFS